MAQRTTSWALLGATLLLGGAGYLVFDHARTPARWNEAHEARALVARIEAFRRAQGRLPTAAELGVDREDARIQYEARPDGSYQVWFGTTLGESYGFDSRRGDFR